MKTLPRNKPEMLRQILRQALVLLEPVYVENVSFAEAVESSLQVRRGRRARTLAEIRGVCRRLMRQVPELAEMPVHMMSRGYCASLLLQASTPRQQCKMRIILHGVLEHCRRQYWCAQNPFADMRGPLLEEKEIELLSWDELIRLTTCARKSEHRVCMPALGLMLWGGIRPAEVVRLCWSDINWEEKVISLRPMHSKTGGMRHVQLHPVLRAWLRSCGSGQGRICPPNWERRWRALRDAAGIIPWRQDVLRHTYASYHAKQFHNFFRLQEDMGHRSAALLRTRYLSMRGVTAANARLFWTPGAL